MKSKLDQLELKIEEYVEEIKRSKSYVLLLNNQLRESLNKLVEQKKQLKKARLEREDVLNGLQADIQASAPESELKQQTEDQVVNIEVIQRNILLQREL